MRLKDILQYQQTSSSPIVVNDITLIPQSRVLLVRLPRGAYVWHRPTTILVERDGQRVRHAIIDLTRIVQLGLLAMSLALTLAFPIRHFVARFKERKLSHD